MQDEIERHEFREGNEDEAAKYEREEIEKEEEQELEERIRRARERKKVRPKIWRPSPGDEKAVKVLDIEEKEVAGMTQGRIAQIINNTDFGKINSEMQLHLKKGRDGSWLAEHYGFTLQLVWAILLQNKTDLERFKLFGKKEVI